MFIEAHCSYFVLHCQPDRSNISDQPVDMFISLRRRQTKFHAGIALHLEEGREVVREGHQRDQGHQRGVWSWGALEGEACPP